MDREKAVDAAHVTTGLMEPLAGWIGRSDHRYTGAAWFVAQGDNEHYTEYTELLMETPVPVSTPKSPLGTTWGAYSPTIYPPTATP